MYRFGCGKKIEVFVPSGWDYKGIMVPCGSTSIHGGVNQCEHCADKYAAPPLPYEDEGDLEYDHRIHSGDEDW